MTRRTRICLLALAILLGIASAAHAQGPAYTASPPTKGALYTDGQSGRYLLGGAWLFRADLGDVGVSQRWYANVAATDGWSPTTVPNAYNAGNFTQASMNGYVGWYRRDFTIPRKAFASYVPARFRSWIVRFESVNYRATVWLNGRKIGSHAGELQHGVHHRLRGGHVGAAAAHDLRGEHRGNAERRNAASQPAGDFHGGNTTTTGTASQMTRRRWYVAGKASQMRRVVLTRYLRRPYLRRLI